MRRRFLASLIALCLSACAGRELEAIGTQAPSHAELEGLQAVAIPAFDSERGIAFSSSRAEFDDALADERFSFEQFTYQSDGLTVGAYLYRPREIAGPLLPVVVYNRGSVVRQNGFAGEMLVMANRFARAGFIVVAPQYRGSNGWAGVDELGGGDLHDLFNVVPVLERIPRADTSRVFLAGESRGGVMVYMAMRDGFPARAAAVWGAFTDLNVLTAPGGRLEAAASHVWPDFQQNRAQIVESRSAIRWAERIGTPVLIMHGDADGDVPVDQSVRMSAELTRLGKTSELLVFEGQQHRIGERSAERDAAAIHWFERYGAR